MIPAALASISTSKRVEAFLRTPRRRLATSPSIEAGQLGEVGHSGLGKVSSTFVIG